MIAIYTTVLSLFVAIALVPLLARVAGPLGLLDQPGPRKIHSDAVPRVGGIAIALGAIVSIVLWVPFITEVWAFAIGSMLIFGFGLLDDLLNLDYRLKLLGQAAGAVAFVYLSDIYLTRMPFVYDGEIPGWIGLPLTVFIFVGITNAVNMSDGMDGLAGGTSMLAICALGYLAYLGGDKPVAMLALAVIGATLGFLRYNTHPARVFLGDAGSQFLGFSTAALALLTIETCNTAISPLVPLLLLALPIIDTLQVIFLRVRSGQSPFTADRRHIHHRLLDAGLSHLQVVLMIYGLQILLMAIAWSLLYAPDYMLFLVFTVFALSLLMLIAWWQRRYRQNKPLIETFGSIERLGRDLWEKDLLARIAARVVVSSVAFFLIFIAFTVEHVNDDIGLLSLALLVLLLLSMLPRSPLPEMLFNRLAAFVCSVVLVYLASTSSLRFEVLPEIKLSWFILIAGFIGLWLRFGNHKEFKLNTMDVLVIFIVALVPNLQVVRATGLGPVLLQSLLLFYACELIMSERPKYWQHFRLSVIGTLAILALRGVFPVIP